MKAFSSKSKLLPLLLLVLLIAGVVITFGLIHNTLQNIGGSLPAIGYVLLFLPAIISIGLYAILNNLQVKSAKLEAEIAELKAAFALLQQVKNQEQANATNQEETVDYDKLLSRLIPTLPTDNLEKFGEALLSNIARNYEIVQAVLYTRDGDTNLFTFKAGYAYFSESEPVTYSEGETLSGQVAKNRQILNLDQVPENYITILSGLGKGSPKHLLIAPIVSSDNNSIGVFELAAFKPFDNMQVELFDRLGRKLGELLWSSRPETYLKHSAWT